MHAPRADRFYGVLALVTVLGLGAPAQDSGPATSRASHAVLTRAAMEADLDVLAAGIRDKWSYLGDKAKNFGVDLDALIARAKARLRDEAPPAEFQEVLTEIVAGLKDGHGHASLAWQPTQHRLPFTVADVVEGLVVVRLFDKSPKATKELQLGDRLVAIDSVLVEKKIEELARSIIASTDGARRSFAVSALHGTSSKIVKLTVARRTPDGEKTLELDVPSLDARSFGLHHPSLELDVPGANWKVDRPAPGVARLRIRSFAIEDWKKWLAAKVEERDGILAETKAKIDAAFGEIAGSDALILDLRDNGGGTDLLGVHLAQHLLPKRFTYFHLSAKHDGKWSIPHGYRHDPLPAAQRFDGRLAILVDEHCFSTTDNFLRAVIENRDDVIVVGRPTNGGTGCPVAIATLPNSGAVVTLCTQRVFGPKGTLIEGRGTVPTIPVRWTAADYLEKRDPDLAAALAALARPESRTSSK